jgi:hypothetical protein
MMPARLDWPSAIGNFLLHFGTLDYLVSVFLKDHLLPDDFAKIEGRPLKERVSRIAQHLLEAQCPAEQQTAFTRLLERLEPVRELRNHIAHGHMYVRLDAGTQRPTVTVFKAKDMDTGFLPGSKHVEFAELLDGLSRLSELIEEFQNLAGFKTATCLTNAEEFKGQAKD